MELDKNDNDNKDNRPTVFSKYDKDMITSPTVITK